jgi:hypothetical protein
LEEGRPAQFIINIPFESKKLGAVAVPNDNFRFQGQGPGQQLFIVH